jgi:hypothetical protein
VTIGIAIGRVSGRCLSISGQDARRRVGVRTRIVPGLDSSLSLFVLDSASEILFVGDAGDTEPSRPSRRYGFEWSNHYKPVSWLQIDGDLAMTHAFSR